MIHREETTPGSERGFEEMMNEFQDIDSPAESLVRAVGRGRRKLIRGRLFLAAATIALWASGIAAFAQHPDAPTFVFAATQIGLSVWVSTFIVMSSRKAWQAQSQTTRGYLDLELERRRDYIRRMRFLRNKSIPFLVAMMALQHGLRIHAHPELISGAHVWSEISSFGLPCLLLAGIAWHSRRKQDHFENEAESIAGRIVDLSTDDRMHL